MSRRTTLAVVLIALGVATFVYQGFAYATRGRSASLAIAENTHVLPEPAPLHDFPVPPLFGVIAYVGGIALLAVKPKKWAKARRRAEAVASLPMVPRHASGHSDEPRF